MHGGNRLPEMRPEKDSNRSGMKEPGMNTDSRPHPCTPDRRCRSIRL